MSNSLFASTDWSINIEGWAEHKGDVILCGLKLGVACTGFSIRPDSLFSAEYRIFFFKNMRKYRGKALSIVLDTIFLRMLCERVISPKQLTQIWQTKWWPKLKVVSFGRFGLSITLWIIRQFISQKVKFQKWSQFSNHPHFLSCSTWKSGLRLLHKNIRYPAGLSVPDFFNYPVSVLSSD